jgi:myo-inositol-1(or 4)-monophosphatase
LPTPTKSKELQKALQTAVSAAHEAGALMRKNIRSVKKITSEEQFDMKLALDVRCQQLIERTLRSAFPEIAVLGEEGISGRENSAARWVVDPIDGTVNFAHGLPHACVSISLQTRSPRGPGVSGENYLSQVGVVYDPFCDELWTGIRGSPARLNGRIIQVSQRKRLDQAMVSMGFSKSIEVLDQTLPILTRVAYKVRKVRMIGSAALSMVYVASGRFDAYIENCVRLWDIAAGGLILECAGGRFCYEPIQGEHSYKLLATNGLLHQKVEQLLTRPVK